MSNYNNDNRELELLVSRAQAGCRDSFGELVVRYQPAVRAVARSWQRDVHEAAELVQEVFLHAMNKIGQLREPACFGSWLKKIAVRVAINRATRRPPFPTVECEILESRTKNDSAPLDEVLLNERRELVRDAVAKLRPIDRDVLIAFYLQSKSLADIVDEFDVPLGTVKRRLHVARQRLLESLRDKLSADVDTDLDPAVLDPSVGVVRRPDEVNASAERELALTS